MLNQATMELVWQVFAEENDVGLTKLSAEALDEKTGTGKKLTFITPGVGISSSSESSSESRLLRSFLWIPLELRFLFKPFDSAVSCFLQTSHSGTSPFRAVGKMASPGTLCPHLMQVAVANEP